MLPEVAVVLIQLHSFTDLRALFCAAAGEHLRLDPLQCRVDAWEFEQAFARTVGTDALYDVLMSYRGSFLGDCEHPLAFDARNRLRRKFVRGVLQLGEIYQRRADLDAAILLYQHALDVEGTTEEIFRALIACLGRRGEVAAVAAAYQRCRQVLDQHFGALPSPVTEQLYSKVSSRSFTSTWDDGVRAMVGTQRRSS